MRRHHGFVRRWRRSSFPAAVRCVDIEKCERCGGRLKLVAFVTDQAKARRYLLHVGLPSEVPEVAPARAPPQTGFEFESC